MQISHLPVLLLSFNHLLDRTNFTMQLKISAITLLTVGLAIGAPLDLVQMKDKYMDKALASDALQSDAAIAAGKIIIDIENQVSTGLRKPMFSPASMIGRGCRADASINALPFTGGDAGL